jgi:hypothetical protein
MMAFYIYNNVRIDFQCFAGGLLFGVGSIFFLVYNGLHIGAVAGHLTRVGYGEAFWGFVAGTAASSSSAPYSQAPPGLRVGYALVPRAHAREATPCERRPSGGVPALRRRGDDGMRGLGRGLLVAAARAAEHAQVRRRHRAVGCVAPVLRPCGSDGAHGSVSAMQVDRLAVELRQRNGFESLDLGFAMYRRGTARCFARGA